MRDRALFLREFSRNFYTTGAILPSSDHLARVITRPRGPDRSARAWLEVGPGTGSFTRIILARMRHADTLTLCEINRSFAAHLEDELPNWAPEGVRDGRIQLVVKSILEFAPPRKFDHVVCGLPFGNFDPELVRQMLDHMCGLLKPGGTLSYIEYIGIRRLKTLIGPPELRARARETGRVFRDFAQRFERRSIPILWNFPPAWVHFLSHPVSA